MLAIVLKIKLLGKGFSWLKKLAEIEAPADGLLFLLIVYHFAFRLVELSDNHHHNCLHRFLHHQHHRFHYNFFCHCHFRHERTCTFKIQFRTTSQKMKSILNIEVAFTFFLHFKTYSKLSSKCLHHEQHQYRPRMRQGGYRYQSWKHFLSKQRYAFLLLL